MEINSEIKIEFQFHIIVLFKKNHETTTANITAVFSYYETKVL